MKSITLLRNKHKGDNIIMIQFPFNLEIKSHLKLLHEVKWSKTLKSFYANDSFINGKLLYNHIRLKKWYVDYNKLKSKAIPKVQEKHKLVLPKWSDGLILELSKFKKCLQQKRLSENIVNAYTEVTAFFLRYSILKKVAIYSVKLIEQFNYDFIYSANRSVSYQNQCINGIKKFLIFKNVEINHLNIERPKKENKLPAVLSVEEIKAIFNNPKNLKIEPY